MLPRTHARKYRLGAELGRGAMGVVYEARHETLDQRVAVKILRKTSADDEEASVRRFEREARIIARLDSPHVVKVIDVDRTDDGVPYLVMERLEGRDLAAEVESRGEARVPLREAVRWMRQVCEAMAVAHAAGVVHRDLKLSNVFLGRDGVVKVLDFGVAVLKSGEGDRTLTTSVAGTPRYMAPEQLLGEPPNPASDVWAIGVMLYRMLGGRFPYDAPTMAAQMLAMMEGCAPLATLAPELPPALTEIVGRALAQGLEQRWASARELSDALAPFAEAEGRPPAPVVPAPAGERVAAPRSPRRAWIYAALLAAGGAALVLRLRGGEASRPAPGKDPDPAAATPRVAAPVATPPVASSAEIPPPLAVAPSASVVTAPLPRPASTVPRLRPSASATPPRPAASSPDDGFPAHL
ncbi:MAG TPA: protein kinase [Labilithrix sp.]|nr:protein kinase [Labilithrix sp.]